VPGLTQLSWNPNKDAVIGYVVYHGTTPSTATKQLATVPHPADAAATKVSYTIDDSAIGWVNGTQACFRLKAYDEFAMSGYSSAVCASKKLLTVPTGLKLGVSSGP